MNSVMYVLAVCVVAVVGSPIEDGSWKPYRYGNTGKYIPTDEGRYIHIPNPYFHVDNPYNHVDNPYNHVDNPYNHADNPYNHADNPYNHNDKPNIQDYESNVHATEANKPVYIPPKKDLPTYKEGCYRNNGTKIINQNHQYAENQYKFNFETENGIRAGENAILKNPNSIDEGIASSGFYEYIGPDGFMYRVDYTADKNGFRPKIKRIETPYSGKWVLEKNN